MTSGEGAGDHVTDILGAGRGPDHHRKVLKDVVEEGGKEGAGTDGSSSGRVW